MKLIVLFIAFTIFSIYNLTNIYAIIDSISNNNTSTKDTTNSLKNIVNSSIINKSKEVNFQESINKYNIFAEFEAAAPTQIKDMEAFEPELLDKENLDDLKEKIQSQEGLTADESMDASNTITIDPNNIVSLNETNKKNIIMNESNIQLPSVNQNITLTNSSLQHSSSSDTNHTGIIQGWNGLNQRDFAIQFLAEPPDITISAGPNHIVQMVNVAMKIWDKNGNEIGGAPLSTFFDTGTHGLSDPVLFYDDESKHWFATIMDTGKPDEECVPQCSILVGVSRTDDPTGNWQIVEFPFGNKFADYPSIDVTSDKFILSVNLFTLTDPVKGDAHIVVADKSAMINGSNISYDLIKLPNVLTAYAVRTLGDSECAFLTSTTDYPNSYQTGTSNTLRLFSICGAPTNNITTQQTNIDMATAPFPLNAQQPPIGIDKYPLDTGDIRIKSAIYSNNTIWQGFNISCEPNQTSLQSCIRFQQIDTSDNKSLLIDQNIGILNNDIFYPTMIMDKNGEMIFTSSYSGNGLYPGLVLGDSSIFNSNNLYLVKEGSATYRGERYGDYFESSIDPVDGSLWISGEYMTRENPFVWSTYIFNLK